MRITSKSIRLFAPVALLQLGTSCSGVFDANVAHESRRGADHAAASAPFEINAPSALVNQAAAEIAWTASTRAAAYELAIGTDAGCQAPVQKFSKLTTTNQVASALADGTYYVCLTASDADGRSWAAANDNYQFTVKTSPPGAFQITSPAAATPSKTPDAEWAAAADAAAYDVVVGSPSCNEPVQSFQDVTGTKQTLTPLQDGTYQLCITARDAAGNKVAAANAPYSFTVKTAPPGVFALTGPTNATGSSPSVTWSTAATAVSYDLVVATDQSCTQAARTYQNLASTRQTVDGLSGGRYYACATARDTAGNTAPASNNGYPLSVLPIVLGQTSGTTSFNYTVGFSRPASTYSDGTRLFVSDEENSRILIWNTIPTSNYRPADIVLGQPDPSAGYGGNVGGLGNLGLWQPKQVYSDGTRLFVADTLNNRVLIWNSVPTTNLKAADVVVGQPDMHSSTANNGGVSAASLAGPVGVFSDGTRLYVSDTGNNRVLIWNTIPTTNHAAASHVLGQPDMTSNTGNNGGVSAASLSAPMNVYAHGTKVFVADYYNNRVLVWNSIPTADQQSADAAVGVGYLSLPIAISSDGTRFVVTDEGHHRIAIWNSIPTSSTPPDIVVGQPDTASGTPNNGGVSAGSLNDPRSAFTDGTRLFVVDRENHRVLIWSTFPTTTGQPANIVLGHASMTSSTRDGDHNASTFLNPTSVMVVGTRLIATDEFNNRVLIWNTVPQSTHTPADVVLGQPDMASQTPNNGGISAKSMQYPVAAWSDGVRLFVADSANNRILIWNQIPTVNQAPADVVLGQPDFTSNTGNNGGVSAQSLNYPMGVVSDGPKLYVADSNNHRVLIWNTIPTANRTAANTELGQPDMASNTANNGGVSAQTMSLPIGINSDGTRLFVADRNNHRVLIWNSQPTVNQKAANVVLGQPGPTANACNNGGLKSDSLCGPIGVFSDGARVFVADQWNDRVLIWGQSPTVDHAPATKVLGQPDMVTNGYNTGGRTAESMIDPTGLFYDGYGRLYVTDQTNDRIVVLPQ